MPKFEIMTLKSDSISDKIQLQGWFQTPTAHSTLSHILYAFNGAFCLNMIPSSWLYAWLTN